jgi:hypothetical protein
MKGQSPCSLQIVNTLLGIEMRTSIHLARILKKLILLTLLLVLVRGMIIVDFYFQPYIEDLEVKKKWNGLHG